jgi:hypothetical protein
MITITRIVYLLSATLSNGARPNRQAHYSARSAWRTSMRDARAAGINDARIAAVASAIAAGLIVLPKLLSLDTGCVWGRELTAARIDESDVRIYQVSGKEIACKR